MERNLWVSGLVVLLHLTLYISGETIPGNVTVHIWEGNVTITWDPPQENPGDYLYQVQLSNYIDSPDIWENVTHCNLLKTTVCNIGQVSVDLFFRVRVGALLTQNDIYWSPKRGINIRNSQLTAPTFTLSSTSDSVRVEIHRKPILDEIFPYGVQYTAYLWRDGQENQTLSKSNDDADDADDADDDDDDDGQMTFTSLQALQVYCVLVKVESTSKASNTSSVHCIKLPLDVTLVICFIVLGLLGIMTFLTLFICFLRRPQKMPGALKLVVNVWKPMNIKSDQVENVTDKGWVIINNSADTTKSSEFTEEDIERRESLDSGVSIEQLEVSVNGEMEEQGGADSGCESLKGSAESGSVRGITRQFSIREIDCCGKTDRTEDSGLGLSHHEVSGSLEGADIGLLSEVVVGDGYRSQSPSAVEVQDDSNMAAPAAGYRSGQVTCTCSDHEYCVWCKFKNPFTKDCQPAAESLEDFRPTYNGNAVRSSYLKKTFMEEVNLLNMDVSVTEPELVDQASEILLSCPLLLQNDKDSIMQSRSFTLENMELTFS